MGTEKTTNDRQVRWLILVILHANQRSRVRESGGWMRLPMLQRLLSDQGYDLTKEEIRSYCVYLADPEIACMQIQRDGDHAPFVYKYRITARGVRAVNGEEKFPGVGLY